MLETQRHILILEILDAHGSVSLHELVAQIGASEATLRRDLIKLAQSGRLVQVRGGAVSARAKERLVQRHHLAGPAFLANLERETNAKCAIAKAAAALCTDGEAIIINGGSTTFHMGAFLRDHRVNVLTNSLALGLDLLEHSQNRVVFPAGEAHRKLSFILNPLDDSVTDAFRASKYFLSTHGVNAKEVMEADPLVARAEQRLAAQADEVILLVDATKIGKNSSYAALPLSRINKLITDERMTQSQRAVFENHGIEVLIARPSADQANAVNSA